MPPAAAFTCAGRAVATQGCGVVVLSGTGAGTFGAGATCFFGFAATSITAADLVAADPYGGVSVLLNASRPAASASTGNASAAPGAAAGLVVDTTAPVVTQSARCGASLTGTGDPSGTVVITEAGNTLGTAATNARGAWSFTPAVAPGARTLTASQTNAAGNTGSTSFAPTEGTVPCYGRGTPRSCAACWCQRRRRW